MQAQYVHFAIYVLVFIGFFGMSLFFLLRKKPLHPRVLIAIASFFPIISLLQNGVHQSGDFAVNIEKAIDLWHSLSYGIFPVGWASLLNASYGYPLFIFTYPLPYYSIAFFHMLGFSFISSEKIIIAIVFLLSGLFMYLFTKQYSSSRGAALATALYLFAPYHLVDMHFRVALGELFAFAFVPLCFYSLKKNPLMLSLSITLLLLSHQAISLVTIPILFCFGMFNLKTGKEKLKLIASLVLAGLLASFYVLPVIFETSYTHQPTFSQSISFIALNEIFFSPWYYGFLYQGSKGQLSFAIGYPHLFILALTIYLLIKGKLKNSPLVLYLVLIIITLIFMLTSYSSFLWHLIPLIKNFQFTYRLLMPITFLLSLLGGILFLKVSQKVFYVFFFLIIGITILNWQTRAMIPDINDNYLTDHVSLSTYEAEGLQPAAPKWTNISQLWIKDIPKRHIEIISGNGSIKEIKRTPTEHEYILDAKTKLSIGENTLYFPGWNLYVNGKKQPIFIRNNPQGTIGFAATQGIHDIVLKFEDTPIRRFSKYLTILGVILLMAIVMKLHGLTPVVSSSFKRLKSLVLTLFGTIFIHELTLMVLRLVAIKGKTKQKYAS